VSPSGGWTAGDIPDQAGRTVVVTGPTVGGLGFHVGVELARRGARVVLAGRTPDRLATSAGAITAEVPGARLESLVVDLASLASVRAAADAAAGLGPIHTLVNNAGVMAVPYRRTADGLESQLATNHFGPFLLTGLLLPQLVDSGQGRVVSVSSQAHRLARRAPLGDPHTKPHPYLRWRVYAGSKLANLLFTFELDRRLRRAGLPVVATVAHPGLSGTHLVVNGQLGRSTGAVASILDGAVRAVAQSPAMGALPVLMAATADLPGSSYCGPSGLGETAGLPTLVGYSGLAADADAQRRLWALSEETVGLRYP
jgi:NAD(P)-dependent dehydrogenase (short-subunit alcohol dehydrogenase family)